MSKQITVEVYLTTGQTFRVECENFQIKYGVDDNVSEYSITGHKPGYNVHVRPKYIAGIRRVK